ncbi:MAG: Phosphorylase [Ferruginibacter sp.]|nr:Phosphorylase [Ferruginibacter sp.]
MQAIPESELILDKRSAIYHLGLRPEELAPIVLLVGDPDRVPVVSKYFDSIEFRWQHREFITHTGYLNKKRISVISTGIGPDNIDIALNELDALANIDFATRTIKPGLQSLQIIRLGTSGALQSGIPVDSFVAGTHGLGFDNVMHFYNTPASADEVKLLEAFKQHTQLISGNVLPYLFEGSRQLQQIFSTGFHKGITAACPGFYGPQGRILRVGLAYPGLIDKLSSFREGENFIANFEMESSAIYGLSRALGHACLSLNVIVANRIAKQFSKDGAAAVEQLIRHSLGLLAASAL